MKVIFIVFLLFILTFRVLCAQEETASFINDQNLLQSNGTISESENLKVSQDSTYQQPGTAFFLELIGKPYTSINVDFRITGSSRISLGIMSYIEAENEEEARKGLNSFMPNIMYYYLVGKHNKKFEIGGGLGLRPIWENFIENDFPLAFHGVIGYRYQKKNGLLFRIGFTPNIYPEVFLPFLGISFGYSL
jgi:hypothetical protein